MTKAVVNAGACGMTVTIEVARVDKRSVRVRITTDCEMVTNLGDSLVRVDVQEALKAYVESQVYRYASQCRLHTSCPVPMAILKAIEVEAGLALPRSVFVCFEAAEQG